MAPALAAGGGGAQVEVGDRVSAIGDVRIHHLPPPLVHLLLLGKRNSACTITVGDNPVTVTRRVGALALSEAQNEQQLLQREGCASTHLWQAILKALVAAYGTRGHGNNKCFFTLQVDSKATQVSIPTVMAL